MMVLPSVAAEQLYDGTGAHFTGLFPPIAVNNVLTESFHSEKALRPAENALAVGPGGNNLGWIWMIPLGLPPEGPICPEIVGNLVQAVDAGKGVVVHADNLATARTVIDIVRLLAGGGHA
jgi:hypothetical protein